MCEHKFTEQEVIRLGIDICSALEVLNVHKMIHRDIKPANIFVNSFGVYKLGDFGESKVLSDVSAGMSVRGTYSYMSPEISRGESADIRSDIYSLGLVMYRLLNGNRAPFVPANTQAVSAIEQEQSNIRRFKGEPLDPPKYCTNPVLSNIVLRACEFDQNNRWHNPAAMKKALESLRDIKAAAPAFQAKQAVNPTVQKDVPPPVNPEWQGGFQAKVQPVNATAGVKTPQKKKGRFKRMSPKRKTAFLICLILSVILFITYIAAGYAHSSSASEAAFGFLVLVTLPLTIILATYRLRDTSGTQNNFIQPDAPLR